MAEIQDVAGTPFRAFVCHTIYPWGFPAKDRSGRLSPVEEPHLGRLMTKIRGPVKPATERLTFNRPDTATLTTDITHPENA
ncbi:MAG: hypothetical protein AB7K04_16525 [Pseudorhodoplanes sp.]